MVIGADDEAPVRELVTRRRTAELPDLGQLSLVGLALHDGSPVEHLRNNASKPSIQWTSLISTHTSVNKEGKENEGERERAYPTPQRSMLGPYLVIPMSSSGGRYHLVTTMFVYSLPPSALAPPPREEVELKVRARPKSAILRTPSLLMSRFAVFMSRWRIEFCQRETATEHTASALSDGERVGGGRNEAESEETRSGREGTNGVEISSPSQELLGV
jgi:hypothetical protein